MKNRMLFFFLALCTASQLFGQAETIEVVPEFYFEKESYVSKEIKFPTSSYPLEFVGLSCYHFDQTYVPIYYRIKVNNNWREWVSFDLQNEFVAHNRVAYQTKPIQEAFNEIQFKMDDQLETPLTIRFFLAPYTRDTSQSTNTIRTINCEMPNACYRDCWCPSCPIDVTPEYTEPTHLIVHHSAGNNQSNDFATVVEYIWDLHVNTNGWDDIGYNWLIDPNGILYEGRPDGYQGAHFSCINENTIGICVIGDYTLEPPSDAALNTLTNLLAYEATEHLIDVSSSSYHITGDFILENLAGHRDSAGSEHACSSTVCPGEEFYPLLATIRDDIAALPCYNILNKTDDAPRISSIKAYPNPLQDELFIESEQGDSKDIRLMDVYGRTVKSLVLGEMNELNGLQSGIYFLVVNGLVVEKFIKE